MPSRDQTKVTCLLPNVTKYSIWTVKSHNPQILEIVMHQVIQLLPLGSKKLLAM
jgi:hypothetical protein